MLEVDSGKVIYSKNPDLPHANASTTKLMTAILAVEHCQMSETVTASQYAASQEPTKLYLHAGEKFVLQDLMHSLLIPSHNDTAVAIGEHVSGSTSKFVELMNTRAKELGCINTHFATPNGLDAGLNHYTTANDLAKIASFAFKKSTILTVAKKTSYSFRSLSGYSYSFSTTNQLLAEGMSGLICGKTGYTRKAGYCFVGLLKAKNGKEYLSVLLRGPSSATRWRESRKLLQYAYNYTAN